MTLPHGGPDEVYRDHKVNGDPAQGQHNPKKSEIRDIWHWLTSKVRNYAGDNLVMGNKDPSPGAVGQVHIEVEKTLSLPENNSYAGMMVRNKAILPGTELHKIVTGLYLDRLRVENPDGAKWTDAATLFIAGPPKDPDDQNGSTSFALYIQEGFSRIRDHLVVGNFDHSEDVLTVNGGTGSNYTLTVRNEGVDEPRMFRVMEPSFDGGPCQEGYPMIQVQNWQGNGNYFSVQTGGRIVFGDYGGTERADEATGLSTVNFIGVDQNGIATAVPRSVAAAYEEGNVASDGDTIDTSKVRGYVILNGLGSTSTYTLNNGFDGQELLLIAGQANPAYKHVINGGFLYDRAALPTDLSPDSISLDNGEHVRLIFRQAALRWVVFR